MHRRLLLMLMLLLSSVLAVAQQRTVTGTVIDASDKSPLPGVTVLVKGTSTGVITNIDGQYSIQVPNNEAVLAFTFVGFETIERPVGTQSVIDVSLSSSTTELEEVVVTAIGIEREKKALGYAVSDVGSEAIQQKAEPDPLRAMTGKVPGVNIVGGGGAPGQGTKINIRGVSSFTGNTQPLFVVDGIPFNNDVNASDDFSQNSVFTNRAFDLDPNQIESITVLKGAAAAAIYGSRAANGAIVITTKSAKKGSRKGMEISYSTSYNVEQISGIPDYQDVYMQGSNQVYNGGFIGNWGAPFPAEVDRINARYGTSYSKTVVPEHLVQYYPEGTAPHPLVGIDRNYGQQQFFPDLLLRDSNGEFIPLTGSDGSAVTSGGQPVYLAVPVDLVPHDNIGGFFQDGQLFENAITINGGGDKGSVSATLSRTDNTGIVPNMELSRTSLGFGGNATLDNGLFVSGNVNYVNVNQQSPPTGASFNNDYGSGGGGSIYARLFYLPRNFDLNGYPYENPIDGSNVFYRALDNPRWLVENNRYTSDVNRAYGNLTLTYDLTDFLTATAKGGINTYSEQRKDFREIGGDAFPFGFVRTTQLRNTEVDFNFLLTFDKQLNEDINLRAMVGHNYNQRSFERSDQDGQQLVVKGIDNIDNTLSQVASGFQRMQRFYAFFADVSFSYKDYLFLNVLARNDISSTLPEDSRSYFYPSISASFVFTEALSLPSNLISFGKVRASYAQVGNEADPYRLATTFSVLQAFNGQNRLSLSNTLNNADLQNELTTEIEFGLETRMFNDKIGLDITYFKRNSVDQIAFADLPSSTGFSRRIVNTGDLENRGWEIGLDATPVNIAGFSWNSFISFTRIRTEVKDSGIGGDIIFAPDGSYVDVIHRTGLPYGQIFGTRYARDDEGNLLIDQALGTPIVDVGKYPVGDPNPDFLLGWNNTFSYKGFSLNMLIDWRQGGDMFSITAASLKLRGQLAYSVDREQLRVVPGVYGDRQTRQPILDENGQTIQNTTAITSFDWYFSDGFAAYGADEVNVYDATSIRLRELGLTYQFPKSILDKTPFGSARITFSGRNLWYNAPNFPEDLNFDPEVLGSNPSSNVQGFDLGTTPTTRRFGVNLSVTF